MKPDMKYKHNWKPYGQLASKPGIELVICIRCGSVTPKDNKHIVDDVFKCK